MAINQKMDRRGGSKPYTQINPVCAENEKLKDGKNQTYNIIILMWKEMKKLNTRNRLLHSQCTYNHK